MIDKLQYWLDRLTLSPDEIEDKRLKNIMNNLEQEFGLENLQCAFSTIRDKGGSHSLSDTLNALNRLLELKLSGEHKVTIAGTDIVMEFSPTGALISIKSMGDIHPTLRPPSYRHGRHLKKYLP